MVDGQLQVVSPHTHIQENNFGNISVVLTRLFILFVSKTGNLQKVCGHYSKTVNGKIFYSYKYLVSYAQGWCYTSEVSFLFVRFQPLKTIIMKAGGNWPITNSDLANKYTKFFQKFVNTINFETL
jgi:hypothetical protein